MIQDQFDIIAHHLAGKMSAQARADKGYAQRLPILYRRDGRQDGADGALFYSV